MKKYLITGYSGFVSKHFLDYLESLGERTSVLGIDINAPVFSEKKYKNISCIFRQVDLLQKQEVNQLLKDFSPDYILHLASYSSVAYSWENPVSAFANNSNIFLNLAEQVRILNISCRILSVGSSEEYGKVTEDLLPIHEEIPAKPISPYAVARVSQAMLSKVYADSYGTDIVITRSFNHIGPGQREDFVISSFAKKLAEIKRSNTLSKTVNVGNIEVVRDFVDVRDVVRAYYLLLQSGRKGETYNVCSGVGHSLDEILKKMSDILDLETEIIVDSRLIRPNDNKIIVGSNAKIFSEIKWKPTISLETSLQDILNYWMNVSKTY